MIYLTGVQLTDVRGLSTFKTELGRYCTEIFGDNHTGKTSVRDGIKMFFAAGGDPDLVAHGKEYADGRLEFSNGYVATKRIYRDGRQYELKIQNAEGGKIEPPVTVLQNILPRACFDPDDFIGKEDDKRLEFLLSYTEILFSVDEVNEIFQQTPGDVPGLLEIALLPAGKPLTLEDLNAEREKKFTARTTINGTAKDIQGMIRRLQENRLPDDGSDWAAEVIRIECAARDVAAEIRNINQGYQLEGEKEKRAIDSRIDAEIAELEKQISEKRQFKLSEAMRITGTVAKLIEKESVSLLEEAKQLDKELGNAKAKQQGQNEAQGVRKVIAEQEEKHKGHIAQAAQLTKIIEGLDKLKAVKLRQFPVDGFNVTFEGKKPVITIDGTKFEQLSAQEQTFAAMQFIRAAQTSHASKQKGDMVWPTIILDNAEHCTATYREELKKAARAAKVQLIMFIADPKYKTVTVNAEKG